MQTIDKIDLERYSWPDRLRAIPHISMSFVHRLLNYGMPEDVSIQMRTAWPLLLLPIAIVNQLLAPHPVWIVLGIVITGIYFVSIAWLRIQQSDVTLLRSRISTTVAAGEPLEERFELINHSPLPVLWIAIIDFSSLPGYNPRRVVACSSGSSYRWQSDAICGQRGIFQLGPSLLRWSDPFGLLSVEKEFPHFEQIVIYPRIAQLPPFHLPYGNVGGARQLQHPLIGSIRSASVRQYQPGDTLRHVHWPTTARHRQMMVTELDSEHGGEVWIVVDLNSHAHQGEGEEGTLEYSIVVAASLAAQLLNSNERLSVGLILATDADTLSNPQGLDVLAPQSGQAQFWQIMGALALAEPIPLPLRQLLQSSRSMMTSRQSIIVITPQIMMANQYAADGETLPSHAIKENPIDYLNSNLLDNRDWIDELAQSKYRHRNGAILIQYTGDSEDSALDDMNIAVPPDSVEEGTFATEEESTANEISDLIAEGRRQQLLQLDIGCTVLRTSDTLTPILTRKRVRREVRSTPMGGVITVEIEDEVTA